MQTLEEIKCSYCKKLKERTCFIPPVQTNDTQKLYKSCHDCREKARVAMRNHPKKDEYRANNKAYKEEHSERIKAERRKYLQDNKDYVKKRYRKYCEDNKEKITQISINYRNTHPSTMLRERLRARLLENIHKNKGTAEYVGSTVERVKHWFEHCFQYKVGMDWDKESRKIWHIDHTMPISLFDTTDDSEIHLCFNWKNLLPLYAADNRQKSDSLMPMKIVLQELLVKRYIKDNNIQDDSVNTYYQKYALYFKKFLNDKTVQVQHTLLRETP